MIDEAVIVSNEQEKLWGLDDKYWARFCRTHSSSGHWAPPYRFDKVYLAHFLLTPIAT